ncbi:MULTISPECIES: nucleotidyltransferase domain-containing protein [Metallosphaera]|uniref:nucleotidyltransferase domain-containing protein n=1 Tax=Metallosphaera TaxID=41980 RepID=UPI001F0562E1|nr:nucleotidyltransferase domain-containing protein [Metallosphaera sedula]MCH1771075.1 nucleotidyltransferase domain-containing protein [Metallosphaera sedula]MCP6729445.1 nucleotidyltransferase domain-containing protein [Metallosphaera sedula]
MGKATVARLIMLFGSRARGDFTESSDYDMLYVDDDIPKDPKRVDNQLYLKIVNMFPGDVDALFMNTEVFMKKLYSSDPFILQIIEEGRIIEKDDKFWEKVIEVYREKRKEWVKVGKNLD